MAQIDRLRVGIDSPSPEIESPPVEIDCPVDSLHDHLIAEVEVTPDVMVAVVVA